MYLCILKQLRGFSIFNLPSCELHSNLVSLHSETTPALSTPGVACCELHSNLVSLHSETTPTNTTPMRYELWITFKSCIFAFWNNAELAIKLRDAVVNYIQILYLCILKQPYCKLSPCPAGCELHSNLVSLHSETTLREFYNRKSQLWITFKSCIFAFWNNDCRHSHLRIMLWITFKSCIFAFWNNYADLLCIEKYVVNYIQILYLCILKQLYFFASHKSKGCELHSNLVSLHSETTFISTW